MAAFRISRRSKDVIFKREAKLLDFAPLTDGDLLPGNRYHRVLPVSLMIMGRSSW